MVAGGCIPAPAWRGSMATWAGAATAKFHLVASAAQSGLGVVGPTPIEAVAANSKAVFTWPQTTQNRTASLTLNGKTMLDEHWQVEGAAYVRTLRQRHVDGNEGDFEQCSSRSSFGGKLCLEDDAFTGHRPPGGKTTAFRNQFAILDQNGNSIAFDRGAHLRLAGPHLYRHGQRRRPRPRSTSDAPLFGLTNYLTIGGSIDHSAIGFQSNLDVRGASIPDLSCRRPDAALPGSGAIVRTMGNLGYAPVTLAGTTDYYGLYAVDALDLTPDLTLTAGFRLNAADIATRDRSGAAPELTGTHGYTHLNPLAGVSYKITDAITFFGNYSQANRAPTPLELDCADAAKPCLLEGSLVADPPLKQVVAQNGEAGLRGRLSGAGGLLQWSASLFRSDSDNDIVALASTIQGRGYFTNVAATRRQGADLAARFTAEGWSTYVSYSFLDATYQFSGTLASPNNPSADAAGNVTVTPGRHIPLNPANNMKVGGEWEMLPGLTLGADLVFTGSQYFDGDDANQNTKLPSPSPLSACTDRMRSAAAGRPSPWWTISSTATPPAMAPISIPATPPVFTARP